MAAIQPPGSRLTMPPSSTLMAMTVNQVTVNPPSALRARGALLRAGRSQPRPRMPYAASANRVVRMPAVKVSHCRPPG